MSALITLTQGAFKGRRLFLPPASITRPTRSIVKEALFNILTHRYDFDWNEKYVIDGFSGSGNIGLEALSLGASVYFCEKNKVVRRILEKNLSLIPVEPHKKVLIPVTIEGIFKAPRAMDLIFLDPPYADFLRISQILDHLMRQGWTSDHTLIIVESDRPYPLKDVFDKRYGKTFLSFGRMLS